MMDAASRQISWVWADNTCEHLQLKTSVARWRIAARHADTAYWLTTDAGFCANWLRIVHQGANESHAVELKRTAKGWIYADGRQIPNSQSVVHPDIACSAFTNTLPIKQLALALDARVEIDVLYIPVPSLQPEILRQAYTRTAAGYLYENCKSGFSVLLTVDKDGLVLDYPQVCKRSLAA